jgi:hypothetical protein
VFSKVLQLAGPQDTQESQSNKKDENVSQFCCKKYTLDWRWDSSVSIVMGYGLDGPGLIPDSARFVSSPPILGPIQPPIQWVPGALSLGIKQQELEADCSPPFSDEVKV